MKGAIILILMLLMGFITAQSIDAMGYNITTKDRIYLQNIFSHIDALPNQDKDSSLAQKFVPYLDYFPTNSRQHILLHEIYAHVQKDTTPTSPSTQASTTYSQDIIDLLGRQFQ